jgi:glucose/arabinose dehydrogenase
MIKLRYAGLLASAILLSNCASGNADPTIVTYGTHPVLPKPEKSIVPTMHIAPAKGWGKGETPTALRGLQVNQFAEGLDHPRWIYVLPNNDVLVAETNSPPKPDDGKGVKGFVQGLVMKHAGAEAKTANRISLLRDTDHDGVADMKVTFLENLNSPFGMALIGNNFYVANTDAILRFPYKTGETSIAEKGVKIVDLPAGTINHHWTKNILPSKDGKYLYATVGSNSNVGENGMEAEKNRAEILKVKLATNEVFLVASGIRNPNGMALQPQSGELWTVANERDELGNDLVPDYLTSVKEGAFYGWPYSYYGQNVDDRVKPQNPELVAKAVPPDYALGAHTASLGLTFYNSSKLGNEYKNGAFIGQHGSWNRDPRAGYKVVFVPFKGGMPSNDTPVDILTGFLDKDGNALGRPVGVAEDKEGSLLVADDVGNKIWRVTKAK